MAGGNGSADKGSGGKLIDKILMAAAAVLVLLSVMILCYSAKKYKDVRALPEMDALTGGDSYGLFCLKARQALKRDAGPWLFAAMDLDQFKLVNDIFGRDFGDEVLRLVSDLWRQKLHKGELFARREGDKFEILLKYTTLDELYGRLDDFCDTLAAAGLDCLLKNVHASGRSSFILRPSLGLCRLDEDCRELEQAQSFAIMARTTVKARNDRRYALFDDEMRREQVRQRQLGDHMEMGLMRDEFLVYYQPKFDSVTREMVGAEALVRWQQPDGSFISPGEFIPLAEKNGLIGRLDRYMFRQVCCQQRRWLEEGLKLVPVSVNLSRSLLYDRELPKEYAKMAEAHKIPPELIQLELTEREAFEDMEIIAGAIAALQSQGFCVLLDDFGCGYASMEILKELSVDVIKMDKSFIDSYSDERGRKILESMLHLAQSLGIGTIAEGVETKEQVDFLKACGCRRIQGYYYSRPLPADAFEKLLKQG